MPLKAPLWTGTLCSSFGSSISKPERYMGPNHTSCCYVILVRENELQFVVMGRSRGPFPEPRSVLPGSRWLFASDVCGLNRAFSWWALKLKNSIDHCRSYEEQALRFTDFNWAMPFGIWFGCVQPFRNVQPGSMSSKYPVFRFLVVGVLQVGS